MTKPKIGIFGLTGCAGDQLQILNCEKELVELAGRLDIVDWVMARSENDHGCRLDIGFVEGVVATEKDLETLKDIRARCAFLVAMGTCAVWGGLPAMHNEIPRETLQREVYQTRTLVYDTIEALPITHFVPVELCLPGCPIEGHEFLQAVGSLLHGTIPELPQTPICRECKSRENLCRVVYFGEICCGAMTRSGCNARCPSHGIACSGCRGPVEEPNYDANVAMFETQGITWQEIAEKMKGFSAPVWMSLGLEKEIKNG